MAVLWKRIWYSGKFRYTNNVSHISALGARWSSVSHHSYLIIISYTSKQTRETWRNATIASVQFEMGWQNKKVATSNRNHIVCSKTHWQLHNNERIFLWTNSIEIKRVLTDFPRWCTLFFSFSPQTFSISFYTRFLLPFWLRQFSNPLACQSLSSSLPFPFKKFCFASQFLFDKKNFFFVYSFSHRFFRNCFSTLWIQFNT